MNALLALALVLPVIPYSPHGSRLHYASRVLVMGLPTTGKTMFARDALTADAHRCVYYDPADDYSAPGRLDVTAAELERWPDFLRDPHCRIVVKPQADDAKGMAAEVRTVLSLAWEARDLVLLFDEVGDYRKEAERDLNKLVRRGRHQGIASVLVSQFATDFPRTCRRAASTVYVFAQKDPLELETLARSYGADFAARAAAWRRYDPPATWRDSEIQEAQS